MYRVGQKVIVKNRGRYCTSDCGEPCAGQLATIIGIEEDRLELEFSIDAGRCSNW